MSESGTTTRPTGTGPLRRGIADFAIALALFWVIIFSTGLQNGQAYAVPLPDFTLERVTEPALVNFPAWPSAASTSLQITESPAAYAARQQALVLLSVTVAVLVAFNLAFWRHLRRAYASPRRGVWRRG